jgi:ribosomal-protein-serine acetyltransferase
MDLHLNYKPIESTSFTTRMAGVKDARDLLAMVEANRTRISTYFPGIIKYCGSVQELSAHLQQRNEEAKDGKYVIILIEDKTSHLLAGLVQLKDIDQQSAKREIGAFVDRMHEGTRIMTEALTALIENEFIVNGMNKLFLRTAENNLAARRLAEKLGFENEGLLKEDFRGQDGTFINLVYYGLRKSQWKTR